MNNFGANNLVVEAEQKIAVQEIFLRFVAGALSLVFVGAFLTGLVGAVIWLTSGGNEGRNDSSTVMMKSSLIGMSASFFGYMALKFYGKQVGIDF